MRRDPIITEDWRLGSTDYFKYTYVKYIDIILSAILFLVAINNAFTNNLYIPLLLWTFTIPVLIFVEVLMDQKNRTLGNRLVIFTFLLVLVILQAKELDAELELFVSLLLALKLINVPLQNFILTFHEDILVPNSEKVDLVLTDHISRFSETDFRVETNEEFQDRINSSTKEFLTILFISLISSFVLIFIINTFDDVGAYIGLAIVTFTGFTFSYTTLTWYIHKRREQRRKEKESLKGEDAVFPELME